MHKTIVANLQKHRVAGRTYWHIVESRRVGGKPRAVPLLYLGSADDYWRTRPDGSTTSIWAPGVHIGSRRPSAARRSRVFTLPVSSVTSVICTRKVVSSTAGTRRSGKGLRKPKIGGHACFPDETVTQVL
jgi:hypothetical protein